MFALVKFFIVFVLFFAVSASSYWVFHPIPTDTLRLAFWVFVQAAPAAVLGMTASHKPWPLFGEYK